MLCNLVRMLRIGVQKDVPNFSRVAGPGRGAMLPVIWIAQAAMMPFEQVLPKDDDFRLDFHVERRKTTKSNSSVAQRVLNVGVEADRHRKYHVWETLVRCTATAVALRVAARRHGACFEASYQRQNELMNQHTKK
eukprot:4399201-Pleurochrysis_carterae.AAC.2